VNAVEEWGLPPFPVQGAWEVRYYSEFEIILSMMCKSVMEKIIFPNIYQWGWPR
jgi:hypothetical protein